MTIRSYRAHSPGTRSRSSLLFDEITTNQSQKSLTFGGIFKNGRNNHGIITLGDRGGGHKRKYRRVNFNRKLLSGNLEVNVISTARVISIEYDPNRNVCIALLCYGNGIKEYIICPRSLKIGMSVSCGNNAPIEIGSAMPLSYMPLGSTLHNVELTLGCGGQVARAAGAAAQLIAKEGNFVTLKLPSREIRLVHNQCYATLGQVGNIEFANIRLGKAGRNRWLGHRPHVRGVAKNPIDHPHGGGEGRSPIGRPKPTNPWGKPALGPKTRKLTKNRNNYIIRVRR